MLFRSAADDKATSSSEYVHKAKTICCLRGDILVMKTGLLHSIFFFLFFFKAMIVGGVDLCCPKMVKDETFLMMMTL